jgi:hypothetical protein
MNRARRHIGTNFGLALQRPSRSSAAATVLKGLNMQVIETLAEG